jgi:hypothetical protein
MRRKNGSTKPQKTVQRLTDFKAVTPYGIETYRGERLAFFLIKPSNLSILSPQNLTVRINALMNVLKGITDLTMLCLSSKENYTENVRYLQERIDDESNPRIREYLKQDILFLDTEHSGMAITREFFMVVNIAGKDSRTLKPLEVAPFLSHVERVIREQGFDVRRAESVDIMRIFAVYFAQNTTSDRFENFDGERFLYEDW